jgi:hypothetical protein
MITQKTARTVPLAELCLQLEAVADSYCENNSLFFDEMESIVAREAFKSGATFVIQWLNNKLEILKSCDD